jgi:hypothetical protein
MYTAAGLTGAGYALLKKGTDVYQNGLNQLTAAYRLAAAAGLRYDVRALTLQHGETDAGATDYASFLFEWRADLDADIKAISGQTEDVVMIVSQVNIAAPYDSSLAILQVMDQDARFIVSHPNYATGDFNIHRTNKGQLMSGGYFAKTYRKIVVEGQAWRPLVPASVAQADEQTIDVTFHVPIPPLTWDTDRIPAQTANGFECADAQGDVPISDVAIVAPDRVRLALGRALAPGVRTVGYALAAQKGNLRDSDPEQSYAGEALFNYALRFQLTVP